MKLPRFVTYMVKLLHFYLTTHSSVSSVVFFCITQVEMSLCDEPIQPRPIADTGFWTCFGDKDVGGPFGL